MGRGIFPKKSCRLQQTYENMLNIINHQGSINQNHNEIPPHTCQNGYHHKNNK